MTPNTTLFVLFSGLIFLRSCFSENIRPWKYKLLTKFKVSKGNQIFFDMGKETSFALKMYVCLTHSLPMHPLSAPKTSENRKVSWYFQGLEKRCIGNEWVKISFNSALAVKPNRFTLDVFRIFSPWFWLFSWILIMKFCMWLLNVWRKV